MNIVWVTEVETEVPTEQEMKELKEILLEHVDDLMEAYKNNASLGLYFQLNDWFLHVSTAPPKEVIAVQHLTQDEWLDGIEEAKKDSYKSGWKDYETKG